jgi:putative nucleotidyltransferase with HDIG domain
VDLDATAPEPRDGLPPAQAPDRLSAGAAAFVGTAIAIGAVITVVSVADVLSRPVAYEWGALLVLTALAGWATLRVPAMPISFSISDTFSIVAALVFGPSAGALTAAVDGLVLSFRMARTRRALHRVLFNIACPVISTWAAAQLFFALAGPTPLADGPLGALRLLGLLSVFGVVNFAVITGMVAVAVAFERRQAVVAIWREHFSGLWVTHLGGVFAAMLMLVLSRAHAGATGSGPISTLEVLILIAPLPVILYVTFRHALGRAADQITQLGRMNKVYVGAIEALAQAIDAKDQVTHDHIRRVQHNAIRLAHALDVHDDMEIQAIKAAALLHDVGKLGIPEHILNKPGRLSAPEFEIMKRHAPIGADILSMIGFPYPVVPIVRHHHESWDGTGYPDGLRGEAIPIGARILAVVDCFDALTSDRPYRPALSDGDALKIVAERRGTMYDPRVVDKFFALHASETGRAVEDMATRREPAESSAPRIAPPAPAPPPAASVSTTDLDLFFALGQALAREPSASGTADALWTHLRHYIPASAVVVFRYDESSDSLAPLFAAGDPAVAPGTRVALGERLSGWVAASQQAMINSDARLDLDAEMRGDTPLRAALSVPILAGAQVRGVLTFYSREPEAFGDPHLRAVSAAARLLASRLSHRPAASQSAA